MITDKENFLIWITVFRYKAEFLQVSNDLMNDRELVLLAVAQDGRALEYASKALRADKEVVLVAVAHAGFALISASDELRADKDVVLQAVTQDIDAIQFASPEIQKLCKGKNPVKALQASILAEELQAEMKPKLGQIQQPQFNNILY